MLLLAAVILGRTGLAPLKTWHWLLLGLDSCIKGDAGGEIAPEEFDRLDRRAIREIFAVHKYAYQQPNYRDQTEQEILLRGPERIENRDRQIVPPSFGPRVCPEDAQTTNVCAAAVTSVGLVALSTP